MNNYLSQLKQNFGKYGSWALWDKNGGIEKIIVKENLQSLIKSDIIFLGLNASIKLQDDWINYHSECQKSKVKKWNQEFIKNLADLIMDNDDFSFFRGAYMTDLIKEINEVKNIDLTKSSKIMNVFKNNPEISSHNKKIFEKELNSLFKISLTDKFKIICIGRDTFELLCKFWNISTEKRISNKLRFISIEKFNKKFDIQEIYHYAYRKKENIKQDLIKTIKNVR